MAILCIIHDVENHRIGMAEDSDLKRSHHGGVLLVFRSARTDKNRQVDCHQSLSVSPFTVHLHTSYMKTSNRTRMV